MNITYKIRKFNEDTGSIIIDFLDGNQIACTYSHDLPIDKDNNIPTGEKLDAFIKNLIPMWYFERLQKLKKGLKQDQIEEIKKLVMPTYE